MSPANLLPAELRERLVRVRRDLHAHPELAYEEERTAALVAERLEELGLAPRRGIAETGVVADIDGGAGKTVLLRADMDALPVEEESDAPYRSTRPGRMHACGHDGHVASLLVAAERLVARPPPGRVRLCFQPAEEGRGGARRMVAEGVLEGVDAAFGVHLWNELDLGRIGLRSGPVMAAVDRFDIALRGQGGHGALPQRAVDPVIAACQLVSALQTIVSRRADPLEACVVTVASVRAGEGFNVIPDVARLAGTCRCFSERLHAELPEQVRQLAEGVAQAHGCSAALDYERICRPTANDPRLAALAREAASELLGAEAVATEGEGTRTLAGEDFSEFAAR
ncbi:MAG: amidohydrolase, partial [Planctomycetota bacterium]